MRVYKMAMVKLAAYYDKVLTDQQIQVYAEQLSRSLSESEVIKAIQLYIDDPVNEFFPRPVSKLTALVKPQVSANDQARNVANIIKKAVIDHQSNWTEGYFYDADHRYFEGHKRQTFWSWKEAAESEFGTLGFAIVNKMGGWHHVCEVYFESPEGVFMKQLIDLANSVLNMAFAGQLETLPALPDSQSEKVLSMVQIKQLTGT